MSLLTLILSLLIASTGAAQEAPASALAQVPAGELLSLATEGKPVYYQDVSIAGYLNLTSLPQGRVRNSWQLINCTVSDASFEAVTFERT
jgi:hypothetical protein